jgi:hypothetical protein
MKRHVFSILVSLMLFASQCYAALPIQFGGTAGYPGFKITVSSACKLVSPKSHVNSVDAPVMFKIYTGTRFDGLIIINCTSRNDDRSSRAAWITLETTSAKRHCIVKQIITKKLSGGTVTKITPPVSKKDRASSLVFGLLYGSGNYVGLYAQLPGKISPNQSLMIERMLKSIQINTFKAKRKLTNKPSV